MSLRLPESFIRRIQQQIGDEQTRLFIEALHAAPPVSVRLNPYKTGNDFALKESISWCENGYYLAQRPAFYLDPYWHAGHYYVQEASSMCIETVFKNIKNDFGGNIKALDLCAAPGGKSTHLLSLMREEDVLVSNEIIPKRNKLLQENLIRFGAANAIVTQTEAANLGKIKDGFNLILVDAPCSGEGLFRKQADAVNEWNEENLALCEMRSRKIVADVLGALKAGGYLIISTCTFNPNENMGLVHEIMQNGEMECVAIKELENYGFEKQTKNKALAYQAWPHKVKGEGFFIACMRKKGNAGALTNTKERAELSALAQSFLKGSEHLVSEKFQHWEKFYSVQASQMISQLKRNAIFITQAGSLLGENKAGKFIPHQELAWSIYLKESEKEIALDLEDAQKFLRKEIVKAPTHEFISETLLVSYGSAKLAWAKVLDNRLNNYLPEMYRIKKS